MKTKGKKPKRHMADRISSRPTAKAPHNPFEIRVNRKKHNILGTRSKNEKGLPGIARSRAIKKRKATLLQEYKLKGKVNMFVDRRIGEKDASMTLDDKITARYTTERMKFHSKKSLYNLDDNEILTHRGESLADIEKFEEPVKSDDEDDDDGRDKSGKLGEEFVSAAHFGGGMLKRVDGDGQSRKDLIDQMIAESKMRKLEQQKIREETLDLTEKLDSQWSDIVSLIHSSKPREEGPTLPSDKKYASYDKLSKELRFEARGKATDKLKSQAEVAKEEKKKLEELEKQRLARMRGDVSTNGPKHRSADDLDDGFDYNEAPKPRNINDEAEDMDLPKQQSSSEESDEESEEESEEEEVADSGEKSGDAGEGGEKDEEGQESDASEDSSDDDLSDLKDTSDDESDEEDEEEKTLKKSKRAKKSATSRALDKLPFTLDIPNNYDDFSSMCLGREPEFQATVLERMIKSNHPSLPGGSRAKLLNLFKYCLQHLQDTACDPATQHSTFKLLDLWAPWLFDLVPFNTDSASCVVSDVIKEKYADFMKHPRRFPRMETLAFFKVVSILFSTSDYRHRIVTPTLVFMQQILASCRIQSSTDVSVGLFVATLILEYTALSRRITPEAINFIKGCLRSAQPNEASLPTVPPFRAKSEFSLHVPPSPGFTSKDLCPLSVKDLTSATDSPQFKLSAVNLALNLLQEFSCHFQSAEDYLIMQPLEPLLSTDNFSPCLHEAIGRIQSRISTLKSKKLYRLVAVKKRPKPLRLYEPKIEEVYTFRKKKNISKEKEERERLMHKYKKEVKGALREIRKDNSFLSKLKYSETKASDLERKRKVKEIFGDAAQQAGEIRKMKRAK